jgi:hypothetical protein
MANSFFKVIFFFSFPKAGWSETYYTFAGNLEEANSEAGTLQGERLKVLAAPYRMDAYRISEENNPRNSILVEVGLSGQYNKIARGDVPWQAQLLRLVSVGSEAKRPLYLRGIPDAVFDEADPQNVDAIDWKAKVKNTLAKQLVLGPWHIKARTRPTGLNKVPITNWEFTPLEHESLVTTAAPTGLNTDDKIQVYKLRGFTPAPGICRVVSANPAAVSFRVRLHTPADFTYEGGAYYVKYSPIYPEVRFVYFGPVIHRDTGRPFGLQRGRQRAIPR